MSSTYTLEQFEELESAVWDALVAGDAIADAQMLEEDFLGVYASGFDGKSGHVGQLHQGPTISRYTLSETRMVELAEDVILFAYRADFYRAVGKTDADMESMYVSSVWRYRLDRWRNIFSQDTAIPDMIRAEKR